jgi:microcystin-dependent protein
MATIAITKGYNDPTGFTSGETVTPAKLNSAQSPTAAITFATADDTDNSTLEVSGGKFRVKDGGVTLAKLVTAVQQALLPAGAVQAFAMNSAPAGWLEADGSNVNRTTYAALFSAISTTYGAGDGSTTFALPDLRGIFVRGSGSQTISGTTYSKSFATKERDAFQAHKHTLRTRSSFGGDTDYVSREAGGTTIVTANAMVGYAEDGSSGTPRTADETRPANIALLYCIKF